MLGGLSEIMRFRLSFACDGCLQRCFHSFKLDCWKKKVINEFWNHLYLYTCFVLYSFWFMTTLSSQILKNSKYSFWLPKGVRNSIRQDFLSRDTLWVVPFVIFDSWPFYQGKSWKTQNTVLVVKWAQKFNSIRLSDLLSKSPTQHKKGVLLAYFFEVIFYFPPRNNQKKETFSRGFAAKIFLKRGGY